MNTSDMTGGLSRKPCLAVVRAWLDGMHRHDVVYCHFKSNAEVAAGLGGITDMDVLADRRQKEEVTGQLSAAGFKRFKTAALMDYPAVDDYLAFDGPTGRLVHLHLHWQLIAGEPYLKGYHLPWEARLLAGRRLDTKCNVFVSEPEAELVLLLTRAVLKLRTRDRVRSLLGKAYFQGGLLREYNWLRQRVDRDRVTKLAAEMLGERSADLIAAFLQQGEIGDGEILALRRAAIPTLRCYRTYGTVEARLYRWRREAHNLWGRAVKRWRQPLTVYRRGPIDGGVLIALLGVDGAGKSTLEDVLVKWLRWKMDVMPVYLGSGDGPRSLTRKMIERAASFVRRMKSRPADAELTDAGEGRSVPGALARASFARRFLRCLLALTIARERERRLKQACRARGRGMIVITDRFPQNQFAGYGDGPLLGELIAASGLLGSCARLERELYERMVRIQPDLAVKLILPPEVALERKSSTAAEIVRLKAAAVEQLEFGSQTRVVSIDATQSLEEVVRAAKKAVWDAL